MAIPDADREAVTAGDARNSAAKGVANIRRCRERPPFPVPTLCKTSACGSKFIPSADCLRARRDAHDTASRAALPADRGFGVFCSDQRRPARRSARGQTFPYGRGLGLSNLRIGSIEQRVRVIAPATGLCLCPFETTIAGCHVSHRAVRLGLVVKSGELAALRSALIAHQHQAQLTRIAEIPAHTAACS